jgi:hypothetical protein
MVVLDIQTSGIDAEQAPMLTEMLTSEVAALGYYDVVAGADIVAIVGLEQQRNLFGCTEDSCIAEIGGALGAKKLLVSQVGHFGDAWVINVKLIDTEKVRTDIRLSETVPGGIDAVLGALKSMAHQLLPARPAGDQTPTQAVTAEPEGGRPAPGALEIALAGGGGAAIGAAAYFGWQARSLAAEINDNEPGAQKKVGDARRAQLLANVGYGVGAAAVGAAVVVWLLRAPEGEARAAWAPVPVPGGVGFALTGSFE